MIEIGIMFFVALLGPPKKLRNHTADPARGNFMTVEFCSPSFK